jgi:hypothetical protein
MEAGGIPQGQMPNFVLWMIIGFGQVIVCSNPLLGLPAGILALLAKNEWDQGQYDSSGNKLKISKVLGIVGIALGFVAVIAAVVFWFALWAGADAMPSSPYGY